MAGKVASGGGGGRRDTQPVTDPNVIPFIDIMLVLLIIFMVTAPLPTVDVRVDLPPPNPVPIRIEGLRPTIVAMTDTSGPLAIYVDGEYTSLDNLGDKVLERAIENNPRLSIVDMYTEARIFLRADQESAYGNVIRVMSRLQEEGFVKVGIVAEEAAF
jgi:biopolymer transport protein ExbD